MQPGQVPRIGGTATFGGNGIIQTLSDFHATTSLRFLAIRHGEGSEFFTPLHVGQRSVDQDSLKRLLTGCVEMSRVMFWCGCGCGWCVRVCVYGGLCVGRNCVVWREDSCCVCGSAGCGIVQVQRPMASCRLWSDGSGV